MTYPSWDMERDRHTFLSFWVFFFALLTLLTWRIKILKNEKNAWGYYHFAHEYHKWWSYGIWFLRYGTKKTEFFVILDYFLPFYLLTTRRIKNLKKKKSGDIILLRVCTIYENHIMYGSWDMEHNRIFFILDRFLHFYSSNNQEKQNYKKIENNALKCNINDDHMIYGSWNLMRHAEFFVILGHFLTFYPTNNLVTSRNGDRKITQSH